MADEYNDTDDLLPLEGSRVTRENGGGEVIKLRAFRPSRTEFDDRIDDALKNPARAANESRLRLSASRKELIEMILCECVINYAAAQGLSRSNEEWEAFCALPFWATFDGQRPDPATPGRYLRFAMLQMIDADNELAKKKAGIYRVAMQRKFDEGVSAQSVYKHLKEVGGLYKSYKMTLNKKGESDPNIETEHPIDDDQAHRDDEFSEFDDDDDDSQGGDDGDRPSPRGPAARTAGATATALHRDLAPTRAAKTDDDREAWEALILKKVREIEAQGHVAEIVVLKLSDHAKLINTGGDGRWYFYCSVEGDDEWVDVRCLNVSRPS